MVHRSAANDSALGRALAPAAFILIWASGYVVAKVTAPYAEPLGFLAWRFAGTATLMTVLALLARAAWPSGRDTLHLVVAGVLMHACYLGCVWVAISQGMPAGVAALIVNLQPVLTAALAVFVGEQVTRRQWLGVVAGFGGVVLVVGQKVALAGPLLLGPTLLCLFGLAAMTAGTLYQKRFVPRFDLRAGQAVQAIASFALIWPAAAWLGSFRIDWNLPVIGAMLWSIVVLTGGGLSLMFLMLRDGRATTVTSYMYLVPAVTALMAWAMFGESLEPLALAGMAVTLTGIWLVAGGRSDRRHPS